VFPREITIGFVNSSNQLADVFTKSLRGSQIKYICNKFGAYDIYAPAWGGGGGGVEKIKGLKGLPEKTPY